MNIRQLGRYGAGLALLLSLTRCQRVAPSPPKAEGFDEPIPPTTSFVAGTLAFSLNELEDKISRELDPVLVGGGTPGGKAGGLFQFQVARSGRVHVRYADGQIRLSTPLQVWIGKPLSGGKTPSDKPFCALDVGFSSPVTVTPNWRLATHIKFTEYKWIIKPAIRILGQEIGLTNLAQRLLERYQTDIEQAIDKAVYTELQLDKTVGPIWHDIQKPLRIDEQYGLWLVPRATAVMAAPISGDNQTIVSHLGITFETKTALSPTAPPHAPTPLPALQKRDSLPGVSDLQLLSSLPYTDINRVLNQSLTRKPPKMALGMLTINRVTVYGGQRTLIAKTEVSGLVDGTVYLRGRPEFDTTTNTLTIGKLDFDTGTADELTWLSNTLIHKALTKGLNKLLTIPLGDDIAQFPIKINQAFAKGEAAKKTSMDLQSFQFIPQKVAIRPDGIQALIHVRSKVAVRVKDL